MSSGTSTKTAPGPLRVATLNIRTDYKWQNPVPIPDRPAKWDGSVKPGKRPWSHEDPKELYKEHDWSVRRAPLTDYLASTGVFDILGFQEVMVNQYEDLRTLLGPEYDSYGVGRDDGRKAGEFAPIFWKKSRFTPIEPKTIWLSDTPDKPSVGWGASQTRSATLLTLQDKESSQLIHTICTHWDHLSEEAQANSALLIRSASYERAERIERALNAPSGPIVLLGDFNSKSDSRGYQNIVSSKPLETGEASFTFLDAFTNLNCRPDGWQTRPYGPVVTYTGFEPPRDPGEKRIDFIMVASDKMPGETAEDVSTGKGRGGWEVTRYKVTDSFVVDDASGWTGRISDHHVVEATLSPVP